MEGGQLKVNPSLNVDQPVIVNITVVLGQVRELVSITYTVYNFAQHRMTTVTSSVSLSNSTYTFNTDNGTKEIIK